MPAFTTQSRGGDCNLALRFEVKNKKGMEKLQLLLRIEEQIPQDLETLTSGARAFYFSSLTPVLSCLRCHFNGDGDSFIAKWHLQKGISNFRKKCCAGNVNSNACHL